MRAKTWIGAGIGIAMLAATAAYAQYRSTEEPAYMVVKSESAFELRDYDPMIVAEVTVAGSRRTALSRGFGRLAAYIFAQDRPAGGEAIAMTAPVLQDRADRSEETIAMTAPVLQDPAGENRWRTRFVMPAEYTLETLPPPPADITLTVVPARRMAAVRFNGTAPAADLEQMEELLREWIEAQDLEPVGAVEHAFYDAPMVPGRFRRNEVMIEVAVESR